MSSQHDELVGRARELAPKIAARALRTEQGRAPDPELIQDLIDAELIQLLVPKRWGGHEASIWTHLEVIDTISAACMSTGWVAAFYIGHNCIAQRLPARLQQEIFADRPFGLIPITNAPTLRAQAVNGGWKVSGRAPWGTGIMNADWVILGGLTEEKVPCVFTFPIEDVQVDDDWDYAAMSATGSNTVIVDNAFVPDYRAMPIAEFAAGGFAAELHNNPLYSAPLMAFIHCEVMPVYSGGLRGAADAFETIVRSRTAAYAKATMAENARAHMLLGDARLSAVIADRLVRDIVNQVEQGIEQRSIGLSQRIALKGQAAYIANLCRESVNTMVHHGGTSNFHNESALQRFFRNINMISTHVFCEWDSSRELLGRDILGLKPNHPIV